MTLLSFLRVNKYPPSLDFLLMTLGPSILLLGLIDRVQFSDRNPVIVFGRVPLFYFLLHFLVIHALTIPFALVRYGRADFLLHPFPSLGGPAGMIPTDYGYSLGVTYLVWMSVVVMVYPLCLWFSRVKARRKDWWLSYL
jgi:ABC-type spermidine/putrescine transport system permease subunit I